MCCCAKIIGVINHSTSKSCVLIFNTTLGNFKKLADEYCNTNQIWFLSLGKLEVK